MKIRKFNEQIEDISNDRIDEIVEEITKTSEFLNEKQEFFDSLLNELEQFRSEKANTIDQIDEAIKNVQFIKNTLSEVFDKMDNCVVELENYKEEGRRYLY